MGVVNRFGGRWLEERDGYRVAGLVACNVFPVRSLGVAFVCWGAKVVAGVAREVLVAVIDDGCFVYRAVWRWIALRRVKVWIYGAVRRFVA